MNVKAKKTMKCLLAIFFVGMSLLASAKMMILGFNIDEEYAVAMGYRLASGDRMFLEMWEPHQMSAFACAFLVWIYQSLFHTKEYLVLFIRGAGVLIQAGLAVATFRVLKQKFSKELSFWAALLVFNALPKWTLVPEFSNLLLWCSLAVMLCLTKYAFCVEMKSADNGGDEVLKPAKGSGFWMVLGAVFYCGAVLCYPSAVLMAPVYFYGLYRLTPAKLRKKIWLFPTTCVVMGIAYVAYFLSHMSLEQFLYGIRQMMTDGEHTYSAMDRVVSYGTEFLNLCPWILSVVIPSIVLALIAEKKWKNGKAVFGASMMVISCVEQVIVWMGPQTYLNTPLVFFYLVFAVGFCCPKKDEALYRFGFLPSVVAVIGVLILTNTDIGVSGMQLLPGMICAGVFMVQSFEQKAEKILTTCALLAVMAVFFCGKGWLVCESGGYKADALFVKQKALYGVARNIYCGYLDGYGYNQLHDTIDGYVSDEDAVLIVGKHSLRYLLTDAKISMYSTISTPTFDERLLEYWEQYPDRYPTVIIVEPGQEGWETIKEYFTLRPETLESEKMMIYFTERYHADGADAE